MWTRSAVPIALALTLGLLACKGEKGDPGPQGPTGQTGATGTGIPGTPGGPLLEAVTSAGTNLGAVYFFERNWPVTIQGTTNTQNVPVFAVKEGAAATYLLTRVMPTGSAFPCPMVYSGAGCAGTALGVFAVFGTGLACGGVEGHAWRVITSAAPTTTSYESIHAPRWNGSDVVRECFDQPGASASIVPFEDLGAYAPLAARVHVEPG